jgi:hypothetical protein
MVSPFASLPQRQVGWFAIERFTASVILEKRLFITPDVTILFIAIVIVIKIPGTIKSK